MRVTHCSCAWSARHVHTSALDTESIASSAETRSDTMGRLGDVFTNLQSRFGLARLRLYLLSHAPRSSVGGTCKSGFCSFRFQERNKKNLRRGEEKDDRFPTFRALFSSLPTICMCPVLLFPLSPSKASGHRDPKRAFDLSRFLPACIDEKPCTTNSVEDVENATDTYYKDFF